MHNLVIDIGNTNSKIGIFRERELIANQALEHITADVLIDFIERYTVSNSTISSVGLEQAELIEVLKKRTHYFPFSTTVSTGITNDYSTPETLGPDRWAKVIAAHQCFPGKSCLIIDAGTCITYDLLTSESRYSGGSISLGLQMRFKALNYFTKRLPLVEWNSAETGIPNGTDTVSAIKSGVLQGAVSEIEGFISLNDKKNKGITVLITGGDSTFLLKQLKNSIFAPQIIHDPYLVLKGLNEVIAFEYVRKN